MVVPGLACWSVIYICLGRITLGGDAWHFLGDGNGAGWMAQVCVPPFRIDTWVSVWFFTVFSSDGTVKDVSVSITGHLLTQI